MTKIPDPNALNVSCPHRHYIGAMINLVNTRPVYCVRCAKWYDWQEVNVGKRPPKKDKSNHHV